MGKISPVSTKYMIYATFIAQGGVEKPDIIGALFGQTEGLLGNELEIRELQKEGKIGRIEVQVKAQNGKTTGEIQIPTALDQSETSLIAAAIETIERIGPTEAKIKIEKIEDVRGNKRKYIVDRAKELLGKFEGSATSREISDTLKTNARTSKIKEFGDEKLPAGDISGKELIVVEGRADVINLLKNRVDNVIGMKGTKLPETIKELGKEKDLILFLDGDRGGKLIAKNVIENTNVAFVAFAPDGKEVEELSGKEILASLRKKIPAKEFSSFSRGRNDRRIRRDDNREPQRQEKQEEPEKQEIKTGIDAKELEKVFDEVNDTKKAFLLNAEGRVIGKVSNKGVAKNLREDVYAIVLDGTATAPLIRAAERRGCKYIAAKNFGYIEETNIELISF